MATQFRLQWKSKSLLREIRAIAESRRKIVIDALLIEGEIIMTRSKEEFVPVDTGLLRSTGRVEIEEHGKKVVVVLTYGGAAEGYAWYVHENPYAFHPVGQWKYLEQPVREAEPYLAQRLADRVRF